MEISELKKVEEVDELVMNLADLRQKLHFSQIGTDDHVKYMVICLILMSFHSIYP